MKEPVDAGPYKGFMTSEKELRSMLTRYYELQGYDLKSGKPTREVLSSLGLLQDIKGIEKTLQ